MSVTGLIQSGEPTIMPVRVMVVSSRAQTNPKSTTRGLCSDKIT
jgi:hypothetical protein